jgi:bisphosphoglycerate-independent phosphoglycerate mutase (AlkP superfamily)
MICKNQKTLISGTATANERTIAAKVEEEWVQAQIALFDAIGKEAYAEMVATVLLGSRGNIHIRKRHLTAARNLAKTRPEIAAILREAATGSGYRTG